MGVEEKAMAYLESRLEEYGPCVKSWCETGRCALCMERSRLWYKYGAGYGDEAAFRMSREKPFKWRGRTEPQLHRVLGKRACGQRDM